MVRIRFRRVGARNQASYRIVAADRESPRDGRFLEVLGFYNPRTEPATIQVDERRLFHWMKHGALPSDAVRTTLLAVGTWERWERYKQGEALEAVLAEAEQAAQMPDPRTRRDDLIGTRRRKRRRSAAEEAPKPATAPERESDAVAAEPEAAQPDPASAEAADASASPASEATEVAADAADSEATPEQSPEAEKETDA